MNSRKMYVVREDQGRTFAYWESDLAQCQIQTGEKDEEGNALSITLDTEDKVREFMPGGVWEDVAFTATVFGLHDLNAQRTLLRPLAEDRDEFDAMSREERAEYVASHYQARWPAVLVSTLVLNWSFTIREASPHGGTWTRPVPVSEEGFRELPFAVCRCLVDHATALWAGGQHSLFLSEKPSPRRTALMYGG